MNARATVTPLRAERRKTISPARRLTRPPPLKHASSPTDAAAVAPAREAGTASSSKLSVPRATATGAVASPVIPILGKSWMWMRSSQSLWMDVLSCGCEGASHLDQLKMCWQIKRIHNFWCNGLPSLSKNLEARTPLANPPSGLNFERPKISHIIKAGHV